MEGGPSVLLTGTSNVAERELAGARPDVAVVGMSGYSAVHGYPDRLLTALGSPSLLLPCHHDDMVTPLGSSGISGTSSSDAVTALTKAVERQGWAGGTRVLAPGTWSCSTSRMRPSEPILLPARPGSDRPVRRSEPPGVAFRWVRRRPPAPRGTGFRHHWTSPLKVWILVRIDALGNHTLHT